MKKGRYIMKSHNPAPTDNPDDMTCRECELNMSGYIMGDLTDDEYARFTKHIESCAACQAELQDHYELLNTFAPVLQNNRPPIGQPLPETRIKETQEEFLSLIQPPAHSKSLGPALAYAATALLLVSLSVSWQWLNTPNHTQIAETLPSQPQPPTTERYTATNMEEEPDDSFISPDNDYHPSSAKLDAITSLQKHHERTALDHLSDASNDELDSAISASITIETEALQTTNTSEPEISASQEAEQASQPVAKGVNLGGYHQNDRKENATASVTQDIIQPDNAYTGDAEAAITEPLPQTDTTTSDTDHVSNVMILNDPRASILEQTDSSLYKTGNFLASGQTSVCAISSGHLSCWGTLATIHNVDIRSLGDMQQLTTGNNEVCLLSDRGLTCIDASFRPVNGAPNMSNNSAAITHVASWANHSCAMTESEITCWGNNGEGQLDAPSLVTTAPLAIDVGLDHSCAITQDTELQQNQVICWGSNQHGQLDIPVLNNPVAIATGNTLSCVIDENNTTRQVVCWGNPTTALTENADSPELISVGGDHLCVVNTEAEIHCQGNNSNAPPSLVQPFALVSGIDYSCAFDHAGIACWGNENREATKANQMQIDSDSDGISNLFELFYGLNPLDPLDAQEDNDRDGYSNFEEFVNETDPLVADTDITP